MSEQTVAAYGTWKSPISSELIVAGTVGLGSVRLDGQDLYWTELRPTEGGRTVLVRRGGDGVAQDVLPAPFNVRSRVHEYGGGSYLVHQGTIYFSNFADQRLYRGLPGEEPIAITPEGQWRYADGVVDAQRDRLICIREDHTGTGEAVNTIVSLSLSGEAAPVVLATGQDFYAAPRLSPDGTTLAWISWNHPQMPWDGTELWIGHCQTDGTLDRLQKIAGGPEESIVQPQWSPDGVLYFLSDRSGWWNLYRWLPTTGIEALCPMAAEFGFPQWVFGQSHYDFVTADCLVCTYSQMGVSYLATFDLQTRQLHPLDLPFTELGGIQARGIQATSGKVWFNAGSATEPSQICELDLATKTYTVLKRSSTVAIDAGYLSSPQPIAFPTENGQTAYGFFYTSIHKR